VLHVGLEVLIAEQQQQVGLNAGSGDGPVDPHSLRHYYAGQLPISLRCCQGIADTEHSAWIRTLEDSMCPDGLVPSIVVVLSVQISRSVSWLRRATYL
jgi:hypothetical protein